MRKMRVYICSLALVVFLGSIGTMALGQDTPTQNSAGLGNILNPLPGETITDVLPMIAVKLPTTNPPIDPEKIRLFLDGDNVTGESNISTEYVFYSPTIELVYGTHNVLLTYDLLADENGVVAAGAPMNWSFSIQREAAAAQAVQPRPVPGSLVDKPSMDGKITFKLRSVDLKALSRPLIGSSESDIKFVEGYDNTGSLDFNYKGYGKTTIGHYDRSVEEITGRANDRFSIRHLNGPVDLLAGDYYITARDYSPFTINGVQMRGLNILRSYKTFNLSVFGGRSQEPQDSKMKRTSLGFKVDKRYSGTNFFRLIMLKSREYSVPSATWSRPTQDYLSSVQHFMVLTRSTAIETEVAQNIHSVRDYDHVTISSGKDSAVASTVRYNKKDYSFTLGRRTIGTNFSPTVLGVFTEKDREGTFSEFRFTRPTGKIAISTFYDIYHDNLHHDQPRDITDQSKNAKSSLSLNYGWILPRLDVSYGKFYVRSKFTFGQPEFQRSETTNLSIMTTKSFRDLRSFNGIRVVSSINIYDFDRIAYSSPVAGSTAARVSDTILHSYTNSLNFAAKYKGFANISYTNAFNNTNNLDRNSTHVSSKSHSNTGIFAMQMNVIPFKYVVSYQNRRSSRKSYSYDRNYFKLASGSVEKQNTITMLYILTRREKLTLDLTDYQKKFDMTPGAIQRDYKEKVWEVGYSLDF